MLPCSGETMQWCSALQNAVLPENVGASHCLAMQAHEVPVKSLTCACTGSARALMWQIQATLVKESLRVGLANPGLLTSTCCNGRWRRSTLCGPGRLACCCQCHSCTNNQLGKSLAQVRIQLVN